MAAFFQIIHLVGLQMNPAHLCHMLQPSKSLCRASGMTDQVAIADIAGGLDCIVSRQLEGTTGWPEQREHSR